jgi:hypothetical protein
MNVRRFANRPGLNDRIGKAIAAAGASNTSPSIQI